jgi:hypothetical protein
MPTLPVVVDNCGNPLSPTGPVQSAIPACEGDITYTWTYTDCEGNFQEYVHTVTIEYEPFPAITPTFATVDCIANIVMPTLPVVVDNCGNPLTPTGPVQSAVPACEGDITYTWTYTDCEGNFQDYVHTVTIEYEPFPAITPTFATVDCIANIVMPTLPVVVDNCGNPLTPTGPVQSAVPACEGDITWTWTYTDCEGNFQDYVHTVTIEYEPFPAITPTFATVDCIANIVMPALPTVVDNCGNPLTPTGPVQSAVPACEGDITYTWTYTDCEGNFQDYVHTVTIEYEPFPAITPTFATVDCIANIVMPTLPVVVDNCGNPLSPTGPVQSAIPACEGDITYTWTYTDCEGNFQDYVHTVTIEYEPFPAITPTFATVDCIANIVMPTLPVVVDNCGNPLTPTGPVQSAIPACEGDITYTWTYTDCEGNFQDYVHTVTIEYEPFPAITPTFATVDCIANIVMPTLPVVVDNCGNPLTPTGPVQSAVPACEGDITWTWTYTDCEGNFQDYVHTVTIEYEPFPAITPTFATVDCIANIVMPTLPVVVDNCGNPLTPTGPVQSAIPACEGDITYTWTYTDCEGNFQEYVHTVTIEYEPFPAITPTFATVDCIANIVMPTLPVVVDNCGNPLTPTGPVQSAVPACEGDITYTWTYTDCEGNFQDYVHTVTIEYEPFPAITPTFATVDCYANIVMPTLPVVVDNCGNPLTPTGPVQSAVPACEGDITWTWTYTDCEGNFQDYVHTVTIEYEPFPAITPTFATVDCIANIVMPALPTVVDNCGNPLTPTGPVQSAVPACEGDITYTWTYTDCEGNFQDYVHTVTIEYEPFPAITPTFATVDCIANIVMPTLPVVVDNCGNPLSPTGPVQSAIPACEGDITYTWTYTDCEGNFQDYVHTVTIEYEPFPAITPTFATVDCIANIVMPTLPVVVDNCGNPLTPTGPVQSAIPTCEGDITYTWTYTDCEGNFQDYVHTVTIEYEPFPAITPTFATVDCIANIVMPTLPVVVDNCGNPLTPTGPVQSAIPTCEGDITYTWTYTDCEGNFQDYVHTVTIEYEPFPAITPTFATVDCIANIVMPALPTVVDNCGNPLTPTGPVQSAVPACEGDITWTWTYTDCEGNFQDYVHTVTIEYEPFPVIPPTFATTDCVSNIVVPTPPSITDNCGINLVPVGPAVSAIPPCGGTVTYIWTYTDCEGNSQDYIHTINIDPPILTITCPPDQSFCENASGNYSIPPIVAISNCNLTVTSSYTITGATTGSGTGYDASGSYNPGISVITWTITDDCNNIMVCVTQVMIDTIIIVNTIAEVCDNQLPYTWNGQNYYTSGNWSDTLTSTTGCDSIINLNLTVNPTVYSSTPITICDDQLPYTWNGQVYTTAGTFVTTLTTLTTGCDSIAELVLTVNPTVYSSTPVTICDDQLPYTWNGQVYTTAGTFVTTLTTLGTGCDSIAELVLTVNPTVYSSTPVTICDDQLPYTWNGQTYTAAGTYSVTLTTLGTGCDSIAELVLTVNPTVYSTAQSMLCDSQLPYTWNGQTYTAAGTYSVTLTSLVTGCDSIAELVLTVNPTVHSTTPIIICDDQLPYNWNGQVYAAAGTYSVTLTTLGTGCDSIAELVLIVNPTVYSSTPVTICDNQLPYSWNGQVYPSSGTYNVILTSQLTGCDSIAELVLTVNPTVYSTTQSMLCDSQLPYTWNGQVYPSAGTYNVTLTSQLTGCDSIAELVLTVNPSYAITVNAQICQGQSYWAGGALQTTAGIYVDNLVSIHGCDSIVTTNLLVVPSIINNIYIDICQGDSIFAGGAWHAASGIYYDTLLSAGGCDSIIVTNLNVNPILYSTTQIVICDDQLPYIWNGQTYTAAGIYAVTLTSQVTGCDSIAELVLTVNPTVYSSTPITICDHQLPYSWNGQTYTAAGIYSVTLTTLGTGCDSIAELILTVNPTVYSSTPITICDDQLPYSWNGQTYTAAGTYSVTLTTLGTGCDSIAELVLTVNPTVYSTAQSMLCDSQLPYTWNGQTYTAAGTYSVTLTSLVTGCDSIAELVLTVNPTVYSSTPITICDDQLPYTWNGQTYAAAGTYSVTLTTLGTGCDSIAELVLIVNPTVYSSTPVTICDNQLPYSWNGQVYPSSGTYNVILTSQLTGCDSIAELVLTVNPTVNSTTQSMLCDSQLPYTWNGQVYTAAGTYSVTLTSIVTGCDSIAELVLTVNPSYAITVNAQICQGQSYWAGGALQTTAGIYVDNLVSIHGCDSIVTTNLLVVPSIINNIYIDICQGDSIFAGGAWHAASGIYYDTLLSAGGCDSIIVTNLNVNPILYSTTQIVICDDQLPYIWNGQTYAAAGTYTVTLTTLGTGCDSIAELVLTVNPTVYSSTPITICDDQLPYSWNGQTYTAAGIYSVTLTTLGTGCDSIAELILTVNPTVYSSTPITICDDQLPYSWNGQTYTAAGTYSVTLTTLGTGCDSIAELVLTVNPTVYSTAQSMLCDSQLPYTWNGQTYTAAGTYSVTLTSLVTGCDSIAELVLTVNPTVYSSTPVTICDDQLPYTWNGQTYAAAGTYSVTLTTLGTGCDSIAELVLIVNPTVYSSTPVTICDNQLPYSWNGQVYPSSGTYNVILTSQLTGCDSIAELVLTVNPTVYSTTQSMLCDSQLPYTWNGQVYTAAGTYSVTLTSIVTGCDSIAELVLTVNPTYVITVNAQICQGQSYWAGGALQTTAGIYVDNLISIHGCDSIVTTNLNVVPSIINNIYIDICQGDSIFAGGAWHAASGIYYDTLLSAGGCDSIIVTNLNVNPILYSTTQIVICDDQLPYIWNGQTYAAAGTYTVTLTTLGTGCDSIAELVLTVNPTVYSSTPITICDDQLPYSWNGQTYTAAGIYSVTLTTLGTGCDSIAELILTVNPTVYSSTPITICDDQLPYSWNGQTYTAAGTYSVTLTTLGTGCDSIAELVLTVNPTVYSTAQSMLCDSQLPYTWNGQTYTAAGTYSVTLTSLVTGCDSIAELVLTVNPTVYSSTPVTICDDQLPYTWNGQTYTAGGIYSVTLTTLTTGCDSIAELMLTVNPTVNSTTQSMLCDNQLPYTWNGQTYAAAGIYSVTLTTLGTGCDSIAELVLTVNPTVYSTTQSMLCDSQLPYTWNGQVYTAAGTYSVTLTSIVTGCDSIAELVLTVNPTYVITVNAQICQGQSYWAGGALQTAAGIYVDNLISIHGCDSIVTTNLNVVPSIINNIYIDICQGDSIFAGGAWHAASGIYYDTLLSAGGCDSIIVTNLNVNPILYSTTQIVICDDQLPYIWNGQTYAAAGTYTVTLTTLGTGCDSIAELVLTVNPTVYSSTPITICDDQLPYSWNGQTYTAAGTYSVTLTTLGTGCDSIAELVLTVNPTVYSTTQSMLCDSQLPYTWNGQTYTAAGIYSVTLTTMGTGCDSIAELVLTVNPTVYSTTQSMLCDSQLPYTWNGQTYTAAGTYSVTLTSLVTGCDSIAELVLTVNPTVYSSTPVTICDDQLPYTWNGQTYTAAAGIYSVTLTTLTTGCDSIAELVLTVNPTVNS